MGFTLYSNVETGYGSTIRTLHSFEMQTQIEVKNVENEEKKPELGSNNMIQNDVDAVEDIKVEATPVEPTVVPEPEGSLTATAVHVAPQVKSRWRSTSSRDRLEQVLWPCRWP